MNQLEKPICKNFQLIRGAFLKNRPHGFEPVAFSWCRIEFVFDYDFVFPIRRVQKKFVYEFVFRLFRLSTFFLVDSNLWDQFVFWGPVPPACPCMGPTTGKFFSGNDPSRGKHIFFLQKNATFSRKPAKNFFEE